MMPTRRDVLAIGGGLLATLSIPRPSPASAVETIAMRSAGQGAHVWFDPIGLAIAPGTTVRFVNESAGNVHTATTYHPSIGGRPLRIPPKAAPWDSGYIMPGKSFEVVLTAPGVYDYYCKPHEMAGMVGRIVVGTPETPGWAPASTQGGDIPQMALDAFPEVEDILQAGQISPGG